jgi:excisionase family DNA binding protein
MEPMMLSVEEFGRALGCGRSTAYEVVKSGRVRTVRLNPRGATRIPVDAVREFIDSLDSPGSPEAA